MSTKGYANIALNTLSDNIQGGGDCMQMSEVYRLINGMHYINWSDEKINKIICYIESGDMRYMEELKAIIENEEKAKNTSK